MTADCPGWPAEFADRYRDAGYWRGETFGAMLRQRAQHHGDRIAVVDGDRRTSYAGLDEAADRIAGGLYRLGIRAGDVVVLQLPNVTEFFEAVFALFRIGALPVFALPAHRAAEIGHFCRLTGAAAYLTIDRHDGFDHRTLADQIRAEDPDLPHVIVVGEPGRYTPYEQLRGDPVELPEPPADGLAFLQVSGGSTGLPKLIGRTHDDYLYSVRASAEICRLSPESVYLCALPAAHNFPLSSPGTLGTLYAGGRVVLSPSPDPEVAFGLIESERVTITGLVPPLALLWLRAAERSAADLSSLQVLQVGGAKFAAEAASRVRPRLGCTLQQVFGMAEGLVNYTRLDDPEELIVATQGRPICPDDEIRIVDEQERSVPEGQVGRLLTRGPYTIRGYYRAAAHNATAFTADGFYRTGDLVRRYPGGYLEVCGRVNDQINRGGEKVSAEEVEDHLLAHPEVHDAAVVSVPDRYLGERACAFVLPCGTAPSAAELRRFLRGRGIATYKVPDRFQIVDEFPVTGVGKVSRRDLRAALAARLTTPPAAPAGPSTGDHTAAEH